MQATTTLDSPTLTVHRAVMAAAPDALAGIARSLTEQEQHLFDGWSAHAAQMSDTEFAAYMAMPIDLAADLRRLLAEDDAR